jgi:hypothetical protein
LLSLRLRTPRPRARRRTRATGARPSARVAPVLPSPTTQSRCACWRRMLAVPSRTPRALSTRATPCFASVASVSCPSSSSPCSTASARCCQRALQRPRKQQQQQQQQRFEPCERSQLDAQPTVLQLSWWQQQ